MCSVKQIEIPVVECTFWVDECPCLPEPREKVEIWRPGEFRQMTTVYAVADVRRHRPGLWAAISARYAAWKTPELLLTHEPLDDWQGDRGQGRLAPAGDAVW